MTSHCAPCRWVSLAANREADLSKSEGMGRWCVLACRSGLLWSILLASVSVAQVPVEVVLAREEPVLEQLQLTGSVTAVRSSRLSPATPGLVDQVLVEAGDRVDTGDLVLGLDDQLTRLEWQAALAMAREAELQLADARRRLEEGRRLLPQRGIAETVVRDLEAEVAQAEAVLARSEAEAAHRSALLERHRLRAPFAGIVARRHTDLGEWVSPGTTVFELVGLEDLRLDFAVAEDAVGRIRSGAEASYRLGKAPERTWSATVDSLVPVADPGARTLLLRMRPGSERPEIMLPGMSVTAELRLDTGRRALTVPRDALLRYSDGRIVVWAAEAGETGPVAREYLVEAGLAFDGRVEIRGGLPADALVVVRGNEALTVGQPLAPTRLP